VGVDFVFPQSVNFSDYQVIVVPPLYIASDSLLNRLSAFVENGGHLVLTLKSGFCDEYSTVRWTRAPGPLRKAAGFSYQEFSNLKQELALKDDPFQAADQNKTSVWAEFIIPEGAKGLAYYDHPVFGKYPAIARNRFGKGTVTYEGTVLSELLQSRVLADVLKMEGLIGPDQELPAAVRVKVGRNSAGNAIRFYLNYSGVAHTFKYPYASGTELLTRKKIERLETVTLAPWDLAIIEEQ
jgi:beta-galactosidase